MLHGEQALTRLIAWARPQGGCRVLDIGAGVGGHAARLRAAGLEVETVGLSDGRSAYTHIGDYARLGFTMPFDALWCSHCLEHQVDPGAFLRKMFADLRTGGLAAITVPRNRTDLVGGHVTSWQEGLLVYQMILAGFDCREARVGVYQSQISVLVEKRRAPVERFDLGMNRGDIEKLALFFPWPVRHGCSALQGEVNW